MNKYRLASDELPGTKLTYVAVEYSRERTWAGVMLGLALRMRAAAPATCGAAMDVPLFVANAVSERYPADTTSTPGA